MHTGTCFFKKTHADLAVLSKSQPSPIDLATGWIQQPLYTVYMRRDMPIDSATPRKRTCQEIDEKRHPIIEKR